MKPTLFWYLENIFILYIDYLILCVIDFQSWKVKERQYLQPSPNSGQGGFKNQEKYGQVTAHLRFDF